MAGPASSGRRDKVVAASREVGDPSTDGATEAYAGAPNELSDGGGRAPEPSGQLRLVLVGQDRVQQGRALSRRQAVDRLEDRACFDRGVYVGGATAWFGELACQEVTAGLVKVVNSGAPHSRAQVGCGLLDVGAA
jgi:hypothetical protein